MTVKSPAFPAAASRTAQLAGFVALAAPLFGLAYVTIGPFIGLGALAWLGAKVLLSRRQSTLVQPASDGAGGLALVQRARAVIHGDPPEAAAEQ